LLESEQARLDEMRSGTRPEEIQIAQTDVLSAQESLKLAESNLKTVKQKAETDLVSVYTDALTALPKATQAAKQALLTLSDVQYSYFNRQDADGSLVKRTKADAMEALFRF